MSSLGIGGHATIAPAVRDLFELAMTEQTTAGLSSRFLRGDRSVTTALHERMVTLQLPST